MFEKLSGKKVLVTGATGFIGKSLCERLSKLDIEVHGVYRKSHPPKNSQIIWWNLDLNHLNNVKDLVKNIKPDYIIHLAGHSVGHKHKEEIIPSLDGNLLTTINILMASLEIDVKKVILSGSMEEPGHNSINSVPTSPYAAAKHSASLYARMTHALYDTPVSIARIFMVYGPGQNNHSKLIPYTILSALKGEPLHFSSGKRKIDWIYIDDAVKGIIQMLQQDNIHGQTVDLGSGETVSVRETVEKILKLIDNNTSVTFGTVKEHAHHNEILANISETEKVLKWKPNTTFENGLINTIQYYKNTLLKILVLSPQIVETVLLV